MDKIYITLKDPDGIYEGVNQNEHLTDEEKEYLLSKFFTYGDYLDLVYHRETKQLLVRPR